MDLLASRNFTPDLVFWADSCQPPSVIGFETLPAVTIGFTIDMYCNPWHAPWMAGFDLCLAAQKNYLPVLEEAHGAECAMPPEWFPLFCDPRVDRDLKQERDVDVCFVGTLKGSINSARARFMAEFKKHHPLAALEGEYVGPFNRSRIVLNQSAAGELNLRLFQASACGALVLNEDVPSLDEVFTPGEDVLVYPRGDARAAAEAAARALASGRVPAMAAKARRTALSRHANTARARHILKRAKELLAAGANRARMARLGRVRAAMAEGFRMLASDPDVPLPAEHRAFYAGLADPAPQGPKVGTDF